MKTLPQYWVFLYAILPFIIISCKESTPSESGQFYINNLTTLTVTPVQFDEFNRIVSFRGPATLTLTMNDRAFHAVISPSESSYTFYNIPIQSYILSGVKEGFFPYERIGSQLLFYPRPSVNLKIDSIALLPGYFYDNITVRTVLHQPVPSDGSQGVALFIGDDTLVSSQPGTYLQAITGGVYYRSASFIDISVYQFQLTAVPDSILFLTARLMTGATDTYYDSIGGVPIFTNLEQNSKTVIPFKKP